MAGCSPHRQTPGLRVRRSDSLGPDSLQAPWAAMIVTPPKNLLLRRLRLTSAPHWRTILDTDHPPNLGGSG